MSVWVLCAGLAWAQGEAPPAGYEHAERIDVYGDLEVEVARRAVVEALRAEGFTEELRRDDYLLLRSEAGWRGEVRLYDDGWVLIKRQPVRFVPPDLGFAESGSPLSWLTCALPVFCLRAGGQLVGQRKFMAVETRTAGAVNYELTTLADEIADKAVGAAVNDLPERLAALWEEGVPLEDGPAAASWSERRMALFAFWDSRTDTPWGDQVRDAVEAFIRAEVQTSEHPFSPAEIAALDARRTCRRPFTLSRRVVEDAP